MTSWLNLRLKVLCKKLKRMFLAQKNLAVFPVQTLVGDVSTVKGTALAYCRRSSSYPLYPNTKSHREPVMCFSLLSLCVVTWTKGLFGWPCFQCPVAQSAMTFPYILSDQLLQKQYTSAPFVVLHFQVCCSQESWLKGTRPHFENPL